MLKRFDIDAAIIDLDGTLLATEHAVSRVAETILARYGAELTPEAASAALGRRPLEAWAAVAASLGDALPSDVTVVNQVADKLLAPVVPAVVAEIGAHGERFVKAAAATKENLAKVDQLALAWLTSPGLPPTVQEQVRDQLAILTAWLPQLGRLDAGAIAYDKLPAIK